MALPKPQAVDVEALTLEVAHDPKWSQKTLARMAVSYPEIAPFITAFAYRMAHLHDVETRGALSQECLLGIVRLFELASERTCGS